MKNLLHQKVYSTENGMPTPGTSGSALLDMFYQMGGMKHADDSAVLLMFLRAYAEDPRTARQLMFHNRNIRGGQGARDTFGLMLRQLAEVSPMSVVANLPLIPKYGRWDDLFALYGTSVQDTVVDFICTALSEGKDKLLYKWMPREGKKGFHEFAKPIIRRLGISYQEWRELLTDNTSVVENFMCDKLWEKINYEHVPSLAMAKYSKAFRRNDELRFGEYLDGVTSGTKKMNAGAIYPHDLVKRLLEGHGDDNAIDQQWSSLPNFVKPGMSFIPVVDVSGSMSGEPILVSLSLGVYLSERNHSVFKDAFITFSERPQLHYLSGRLSERVRQLKRSRWEMNTNLEAVFTTILAIAVKHRASQADLPTHIIILSDMQFDQCVSGSSYRALNMIDHQYREAGYERPQVIFWNLRTSNGVPVEKNEAGVALLSGFSPSAMKAVLADKTLNPMDVMYAALAPYSDVR